MCKPFPSSLYSSSLARKIPTTSSSGGYKSPAIFQRRKVFGSRSPVTIAAGPLGSLWKTVGRASSFLLPRVPTESARTTVQHRKRKAIQARGNECNVVVSRSWVERSNYTRETGRNRFHGGTYT